MHELKVTVRDGGKIAVNAGVKHAYKSVFAPIFTSDILNSYNPRPVWVKSPGLNFWYDFPTADAALDRPSNQQQCTGSKGRGRNDFLWRTQRISHRKPYAGIAKKGGFLKSLREMYCLIPIYHL